MKKFFIALIPIFLIFILAFGVGMGLTLYFKQNLLFNPLVQRLMIIAVMGIETGLSVRVLLRHRHNFWRILLIILVIPFTLFVLDRIYPTTYSVIFFQGNWKNPNWGDFSQAVIGSFFAIFFLVVGAKPKRDVVIARSRPVAMKSNESDSGAKLRKPALKKVLNKKGQTPKHTARKVLNLAKLSNWPVRSSRLRRKNVVLLGHMEHRCPYCLELVKKNDPRGVVICPECKTWHHKDCWDITGTCQVAHRHDL